MAQIGLSDLYCAKISLDSSGLEIYESPQVLAKAIQAGINVESYDVSLYADDALEESETGFKSGTLSLGVSDLGEDKAAMLTGATIDENGVLIATAEDRAPEFAIGFRSLKPNGKYRFFWIYRVKFGVPNESIQTKGDDITYQTPTIEGKIMRRRRPDTAGKHPWKADVVDGVTGVAAAVISGWFNSVYAPGTYVETRLESLEITNVTLDPTFDPNVTGYTGSASSNSTTITAEAIDEDADVTIKVNGVTVTSTATLTGGLNTVTVRVDNNGSTRVYTVLVTV